MSFIISLGAGQNQVPYIKEAHQMGYNIIAIDINPLSPGFKYANIKIIESIFNYRKIEYKIKSLLLSEPIKSIICATYGKALLTYAYLAERFKLIGLDITLSEIFLDKYRVRTQIKPNISYFKQPHFVLAKPTISKTTLNKIGFPMIIKDRYGSSKKNIFYAQDTNELTSLLKNSHLQNKLQKNISDFILESFIDAPEITVVGFVQNFKFELICMTDKKVYEGPPFIELEHIFPSQLKDTSQEIINMHQQIVDNFTISTAPIVSEWKYYKNNFYLIEMSLQPPGEFLASFTIPKALKYNYFYNYILLSLGLPINKVKIPKKSKQYCIEYIIPKLDDQSFQKKIKYAYFSKILNLDPKKTPESNDDRYAVMGYIKK